MGEHLTYERYIWFDRQIRQERNPNAISLARHFEISEKTARRTIDFMRTMLHAQLYTGIALGLCALFGHLLVTD